jgi:catechol 2,3-dioxygenase-like lactoylglutathione lyase family enzyme
MNPIDTYPFKDSALTIILVVSDLKRSKSFYIDILGAEFYREYDSSLVIKFLDNWILLVLPGEPTDDKPDIHYKIPQDPNKVSFSFTIRVQSCKESYEILQSRGVLFLTPPMDRGSEVRCFFKDPDGHLLEISEYRATR